MVTRYGEGPSWKALSEPKNSLRMAILPVWRRHQSTRDHDAFQACWIRQLFGRTFPLIE
jgi:hypothetical protein